MIILKLSLRADLVVKWVFKVQDGLSIKNGPMGPDKYTYFTPRVTYTKFIF